MLSNQIFCDCSKSIKQSHKPDVVLCFASHVLPSPEHGLHGVWCLFQGWDVGTLGIILSGCVTQDPRPVGPSVACAVHPTHPVRLVACTSEAYCCACRLVHK